jgi:spermidine synthase
MNRNFPLILLLFFFSGASALVYEVLWLKELGLLFGNASYAMATTLAAFFLGLAVGGYHWGSRVQKHKNPLQLYGILECCVAVCAGG